MLTPEPTLSNRMDPTPRACNASASCAALPFLPGSSGEVQSRSVGPLPAKNTMHGAAAADSGRAIVEGRV